MVFIPLLEWADLQAPQHMLTFYDVYYVNQP